MIVADDCETPEAMRRICLEQDGPLITTPQSASALIDQLRIYLGRVLAEVIEEWLLVRVARGLAVPSLDGITVKVRRAS